MTAADRITRQMDTWHECKEPGEKCELHRKLEAELTEARDWVRKLTSETRVLTCVYCGHAYPPGTPSHGSPVLTEHIASCERHPLTIERAAHERTQAKLADVEACLLAAQGEAAAMREGVWMHVLAPTPPNHCCRVCHGLRPGEPNPRGFTNVGHQKGCPFRADAGRAIAERVKHMRAVLVYARDQLDHLAKFHGYDLTLLRQVIVKLLGDPAPEVGSTFSDVLAALDEKGGAK